MSIKEIAKRAQVSSATVSRVLNNPDYKCSSPQVRERIRKAAIELNYVPNEAARRLKTGSSSAEEKTCYINILMTRTDSAHVDPFFDELLRVVETEIHRNNCILSQVWYRAIFSSDKRCRRENIADIIEKMYEQTEGHCDGLIVIGKCNKEALALFRKKYKNVVCVNRNASSGVVDEVVCDGEKIAFMAVEHLIELGHKNIGYIGECHNEARYRGFVEALYDHHLELDPDFVIETNQTEAKGYEAMEKLLAMPDYPTGIYCANDITAVGVLKLLSHRKNIYMPSVIASDDIEQAQFTTPMLTTVHLPKEDMGKFALWLLLDRINNGHKAVTRMELECKLMVRSSCTSAQENGWSDYCI